MKHDGAVTYAGFSPDGRRIVTASGQGTARIWNVPISDDRPSDDWIRLAQMLSGSRFDLGGELVPLTPKEFRDSWRVLRAKYPADLSASSR
jgi:WD40 repeat protein